MAELQTGSTPELMHGAGAFNEAFDTVIADASTAIDIYSPDLSRHTVGSEHVANGLIQWIHSQPKARVRVFVHNAQTAMYRGNPLIELGLKLTSFFEFREPLKKTIPLREMMLIDGRKLIRRSKREPDAFELWTRIDSEVLNAKSTFEDYWLEGQQSQNIRNLNI